MKGFRLLTRLIIAFLLSWLPPKPALAYFSHSVEREDMDYKVHAGLDPDCIRTLNPANLDELRDQLQNTPFPENRIFRGCFFALFTVRVQRLGTYSFIHNGYVKQVAVWAQGVYTEVPIRYENDTIVADIELKPGSYEVFVFGKGPGQLSVNQWGLGNASYMIQRSNVYKRTLFLISTTRGICMGVLGIMAVFFLFMMRENNRVLLIYGCFILINIIFIESMRSLFAELFGFRSGQHYFAEWNMVAQIMGALTQLSLGIFFGAFYEIRKNHPRLYRYLRVVYGLILFEFPVILLKIPFGHLYMSFIILVGTLALMGIAVWFSIRHGGLYHLMLIGYGVMLSFTQYFVLSSIGVFQVTSLWGRDVHLIGSTIEVIFFSIATSRKLNNQLTLQKKQNEHVLDQLQKIIHPHQLREIRNGHRLEETMPTGKAEACVLAFDIIGSSRIQHDRVKDFIERAIELCISNMYERYDAVRMAADAYRIKVIGDGFLCSIGFPFPTPDACPVPEAAVRLAMRMMETFHAVVREFNYHEPIHCAIGLAYGSIEAYYPQMGTKAYDLYGQAIVLATRYEQLRKQLFSPEDSSYIILQERVHAALSPELQNQFICIDLVSKRIRVRDDEHARQVFVWVSPPKAVPTTHPAHQNPEWGSVAR